ncbi:hypothetical protein PAPYR_9786 [Paratrimastix pyriformis]|uniref:UBA domain-containing protein n=1 Tax=Paratrimastix pyriformis TaxID=342808 RepID=A0ABQ8U995_9EUKA|nr:hypothetical protein PAPYR_9786 [Paratrimastix pyriformis]
MGFSQTKAASALEKTGGNLTQSVRHLLGRSPSCIQRLETLKKLGFPEDVAKKALLETETLEDALAILEEHLPTATATTTATVTATATATVATATAMTTPSLPVQQQQQPLTASARAVSPAGVPPTPSPTNDDQVDEPPEPAAEGDDADGPTSGDGAADGQAPKGDKKDRRPMCRYGAHCYRHNPEHLRQFRHPPRDPGVRVSDEAEQALSDTELQSPLQSRPPLRRRLSLHRHDAASDTEDNSKSAAPSLGRVCPPGPAPRALGEDRLAMAAHFSLMSSDPDIPS